MKQEFKTTWLDALRSGEYQQITGSLRTDEGFCALGIGLDIIDSSQWRESRLSPGTYFWGEEKSAANALGLPDAEVSQIHRMNDGRGPTGSNKGTPMPLSDIADWIKNNVPVEA